MNTIKYLQVKGLHGKTDVNMEFNKNLNVILGKNGTGKTTISNMIAHIMRGDLYKFVYIEFEKIEFGFHNGKKYELTQSNKKYKSKKENHYHVDLKLVNLISDETEIYENICTINPHRKNFNINYVNNDRRISEFWYWPANRSLDEASKIFEKERGYPSGHSRFQQILFGPFTAKSGYMTFGEILNEIKNIYVQYLSYKNKSIEEKFNELNNLINKLAKNDELTTEDSKELIILFKQKQEELDNIEKTKIKQIEAFMEQVNSFLNNKYFEINEKGDGDSISFMRLLSDDNLVISLDEDISQVLSAGERQFIPMLYQATVSLKSGCLVVDEPEISLDVEWQSALGKVFSEKKECQVICFTHSYSFSESFNWGNDTFYLVKDDNVISNIKSKELN